MKKIILAGLVLTATLLTGQARASVSDGTLITPDEISPLMAWVSKTTNVDIPAQPIATASGRVLKTALGLEGAQQARAMAAYLPGQIIINNIIWDPESLTSQSYIVHELVHHAQLVSGRHYECNNAKEREAYTLQNQWLTEHGGDPIVTQGWIDRMSACSNTKGEELAMN